MIATSQIHPEKGFSLIETTIAFSIVAVTLVSVMALMGGVITTSGETVDRFATGRIFQELADGFQMKDWDSISKIDNDKLEFFYFDEKGEAVEKADFAAIYVARVLLLDPPGLPGISAQAKAKLTGRPQWSEESRRVKIEISTQLNAKGPFANSRFVREFSTLIVKLDK